MSVLDEDQLAALECSKNRVVIAGPGAGKTHTLVEMISKELDGLPSYQGIIACSYTNKACDELRDRCKTKGLPSAASFFGTLHSFCINQLIIPFGWRLGGRVNQYKIVGSRPSSSLSTTASVEESRKLLLNQLKTGEFTFDDCGDLALMLLENVPEAVSYITSKYVAVMVDEYQDTSKSFHQLFLKLVEIGLRGTAIGDIDQSIYEFQENRDSSCLGELLKNKNFESFQLWKNHRSNPAIKVYADVLMGNHYAVDMPSEKPVRFVEVNGNTERTCQCIARVLPKVMEHYGVDEHRKIAILARRNDECANVAKCLAAQGLATKLFEKNTPLESDTSLHGAVMRDVFASFFNPCSYEAEVLDKWFGVEALDKLRAIWYARLRTALSYKGDRLVVDEETIREFSEAWVGSKCPRDVYDKLRCEVVNKDKLVQHYRPPLPHEIQVMTYHKAKGLEFDVVFCLDCRDGVFPPHMPCAQKKIQQEKNLLYVGITRAKKACYLICDIDYRGNGTPSSFITSNPSLMQMHENLRWEKSPSVRVAN